VTTVLGYGYRRGVRARSPVRSSTTDHVRTEQTYMALRRRVHYKRRSTRAKLLDVQKPFPVTKRSRRSAVGIVTRLCACRSVLRIPVGEKDLSLLQNVHTGSEVQPASYSVDTGILYRGCDQGVTLTSHLHLEPRLRMSEATRISTLRVCFHGIRQETLPSNFLIRALRSILLSVSFIIINCECISDAFR